MARLNAYIPDALLTEWDATCPEVSLSRLLQSAMRETINQLKADPTLDFFMECARAGSVG